MAFTDTDLRRLKDAAYSEKWEGALVELIKRLEAAETVIPRALSAISIYNRFTHKDLVDAVIEWRKAAGKE